VTYDAKLHPPPADLPLADGHTVDSFSQRLEPHRFDIYRRWAFESAALDLALRQAGLSLADALGREPRPVRFVVSKRFESIAELQKLLDRYPGTHLKLDPTSDWDDGLVKELVARDAVDVVDLKGAYHGTPVDQPPDAALYDRVARGFPDAWIEDPALTPETEPVLAPHRDRITWDAPIHSVADVEGLPFQPRTLNVKPSRFGPLRELFAFYDHCAAHGIGLYGGGQFELGPGRGQIQYLASLFSPDGPNDVAPGGYNAIEPPDGLPVSPLVPAPAPAGFRWGAP
jgi:L-alanine-DL-glutamate epimerase-like enolase superfamily enzyme